MDKLKVLYVCPYSHYAGHHQYVVYQEPLALKENGIDVAVLTYMPFDKKTDGIEYQSVLDNCTKFRYFRQHTYLRWFLMVYETWQTLNKAVEIYKDKGFDAIFVRDGEPFIFLHRLVSCFHRNIRWIVSLTGAGLSLAPMRKFTLGGFVYKLAVDFINGIWWHPVYSLSKSRNKFTYTVQNKFIGELASKYMNGSLKNIKELAWGFKTNNKPTVTRYEAREKYGIPQHKFVVLSFGVPHSGKDFRTLFHAVSKTDMYLIHGGYSEHSIGESVLDLRDEFKLQDRSKILNYQVYDDEKPYLFAAADVIVLAYRKYFISTASVLWEACKYQIPIVASNNGQLGYDVQRYGLGYVYQAENVYDLLNNLNMARNYPLNTLKTHYNMWAFLDDYSEENWVRKFKEML